MHARPAQPRDVVVQRVAYQRVREPQPPGGGLDEQAGHHARLDGVQRAVLVTVVGPEQHVDVDVTTHDGRQP